MRRKSERTASKKAKPSPEKKVEKPKRTRSRRSKKPSTSSENDSPDEGSPVREPVVVEAEVKPPTTPAKEASPEDAPDQVWQVKSAQSTSETGEIQKLKICLTRPPSTPERVERSPRSRRKHARATSSSDTPSGDGSEEKKKRHRSRRSTRESNDDGSEKNHESQSDEPEKEQIRSQKDIKVKLHDDAAHSTQPMPQSDDTPMSTTTEENKCETVESTEKEAITTKADDGGEEKDKSSNADTTVASPKQVEDKQADNVASESQANSQCNDSSPVQIMEVEIEKSSVSENHSKEHTPEAKNKEPQNDSRMEEDATEDKVSKVKELIESEQVPEISQGKDNKATNENDVVEKQSSRPRTLSGDSNKNADEAHKTSKSEVLEQTDSIQSTPADPTSNGQATPTPIVINRKRRWGSRTSKLTTQKSITISTDVLKDIIPDVKPVEFEEVIEEKKHKRVDMNDRIERPILPKIIIDNTEHVEKRDQEDKENVKSKDILPMSNRKISIVRDNDDLITRPPSPPRHKQSNILYITNLVRPFTLPQLKNLLQRTGRIAENGFWIDRIKSRCFVIYENEDQAVETRHALHGVTWPVSNPKALQVDFSSQEAFDKAKANEDTENTQSNTIPGTVEDWLREQDMKRDHGDLEKPWERKTIVREWDVGKGDKPKDDKMINRDVRSLDNRRHRTPERSPEPAKKFKKKEEEAPAKLLDDLFRKTKTTPCIYWLPLSAETISVKEEQRRQHMAEHERRLHELRRHRRH